MTGSEILGMLMGLGLAVGMALYFVHVWRHPGRF